MLALSSWRVTLTMAEDQLLESNQLCLTSTLLSSLSIYVEVWFGWSIRSEKE
jgi:hypothetical protein